MSEKRIRQSVLIAGIERSGKTYFAEQVARQYIKTGRTAIIYNVGNDNDFSGAEIVTPLLQEDLLKYAQSKEQRLKIKNNGSDIALFRHEGSGKIYHFKDLRSMFAGKLVKIYRLGGEFERYFATTLFNYVYDSMVVFDDNRAQTRHGLTHNMVQLVSRKNHAGNRVSENSGLDLFFIYHNLDVVPSELYNYLTRLVMFKLNVVPDMKIENPELDEIIRRSYNALKTLPRFSSIEIILREYETIKTIIKPFKQ